MERAAADAAPELSAADRRTLLRLARQTLQDHLGGNEIAPHATESSALLLPRATFVTLRRRDTDELRGCRGECEARHPLVESVVLMAIAAAVNDSRFPPVRLTEIPDLKIEINALTPLKPIRPADIVVGKHGLMIIRGDHLGLLLPEVPIRFGWGREKFLGATCRKAGLPESAWKDEDARLFGFEAEIWSEDEVLVDDGDKN
jgi:AmmeMemoRadiSam system protein A